MATRHTITTPVSPVAHCDELPTAGHSHLLTAFLRVGLTTADKALGVAECPNVRFLVERAKDNLLAAHDLIETDRLLAA
ncbi:hypothetical protein OAX78_03470 [Planctomycetota bacterium]|nr:hypothetical protein [Planctomycetota bacterium]